MNWLPMLLAMVLGGVMDELALVGSVSADETRASDVFFRHCSAEVASDMVNILPSIRRILLHYAISM